MEIKQVIARYREMKEILSLIEDGQWEQFQDLDVEKIENMRNIVRELDNLGVGLLAKVIN